MYVEWLALGLSSALRAQVYLGALVAAFGAGAALSGIIAALLHLTAPSRARRTPTGSAAIISIAPLRRLRRHHRRARDLAGPAPIIPLDEERRRRRRSG